MQNSSEIVVILSLQEGLRRMPRGTTLTREQLEIGASSVLVPLEYEKLDTLVCPQCGAPNLQQISRGSLSARKDVPWPYACPAGDEHKCICKECGLFVVVRFWFCDGEAQTTAANREPKAQSALPDEIAAYLTEMLREVRASQTKGPSSNPVTQRYENFLIRFCEFMLKGGPESEPAYLLNEIDWLRANRTRFPKSETPPPNFLDSFVTLLNSQTPKHSALMADFMRDHSTWLLSGQDDKAKIQRQIDELLKIGAINSEQAEDFRSSLTPSTSERELTRMFVPWWKRLFQ